MPRLNTLATIHHCESLTFLRHWLLFSLLESKLNIVWSFVGISFPFSFLEVVRQFICHFSAPDIYSNYQWSRRNRTLSTDIRCLFHQSKFYGSLWLSKFLTYVVGSCNQAHHHTLPPSSYNEWNVVVSFIYPLLYNIDLAISLTKSISITCTTLFCISSLPAFDLPIFSPLLGKMFVVSSCFSEG